ncbi:MAG: DUF2513 domain-containing protein [Sutterella sp.]|nr:DUF2513 domain-containing protein [Sutterella sp.]
MKIDWNLVRTILAHVETETIGAFVKDKNSLEKWTLGQPIGALNKPMSDGVRIVYGHIQLLIEGGFINGIGVKESLDGSYRISISCNPKLTLEGYLLLESLRQDGFWAKLTQYAKEHSIPITLDTVKTVTDIFLASLAK